MFFGSDNQSGASSQILEIIQTANAGNTHGYGDDEWTKQGIDALKDVFECDLEAYFVATGTASNCLALSCLVQPWQTILCHHQSHIIMDESTAPELFSGGARLKSISKGAGKLTAELLETHFKYEGQDVPHNSLSGAISITQVNEVGLVYTPVEIKALTAVAKDHGLNVHMDGARFANALAKLKCTPAELTWKSGVDVLSLGATKCGALCAEAVIFFNKELADSMTHRRKRTGHLISKGRLFGAQFVGWLKDGHWLELANHANNQALQLAEALSPFKEIQLIWPVQSNELFVTMPKDLAKHLQAAGAEFYEWYPEALPPNVRLDENNVFVRLVTSFATQDNHRVDFSGLIQDYISIS